VNYQNIRNRNIFIFDEKMDNLKVEFTFFPFENIQEYDFYNKNLRINSVLDIAVNKIHAISERLEVKDLYDIYFILQNEKIILNDLFV
jgi:predicted nucleotidyltransferase component of viral defense system